MLTEKFDFQNLHFSKFFKIIESLSRGQKPKGGGWILHPGPKWVNELMNEWGKNKRHSNYSTNALLNFQLIFNFLLPVLFSCFIQKYRQTECVCVWEIYIHICIHIYIYEYFYDIMINNDPVLSWRYTRHKLPRWCRISKKSLPIPISIIIFSAQLILYFILYKDYHERFVLDANGNCLFLCTKMFPCATFSVCYSLSKKITENVIFLFVLLSYCV